MTASFKKKGGINLFVTNPIALDTSYGTNILMFYMCLSNIRLDEQTPGFSGITIEFLFVKEEKQRPNENPVYINTLDHVS